MQSAKKIFLVTAGVICMGLGIIGAFLPVWPTTPFFLVSAFCFMRSSQKLYTYLTEHRLWGAYLKNYLEHHAMRQRAKITSLTVLWLGMGLSIILVKLIWVQLLLVAIALATTVHLLKLKTLN